MTEFGDTIREALEVLERSLERTRIDGQVEWETVLTATEQIRKEVGLFEGAAVSVLRSFGRSWAEIGDELGISRQAAWERFHQSVDEAKARVAEAYSDEDVPS